MSSAQCQEKIYAAVKLLFQKLPLEPQKSFFVVYPTANSKT